MNPPTEIPLTGGNVNEGVVRVGDTVRRPAGDAGRARPAAAPARGRYATEPAHRLRVLADAYGLDERQRVDLVPLLARRSRAMYDFLAEQSALGVQPWTRHWQEGHGDSWLADAEFTARHEDRWRRALLD